MKDTRRMKRMSRNRKAVVRMNLTSLMDVFTILVFFLLVNSANTEVLETPKHITLPASVVEDKPDETIVIFISPDEITLRGKVVANSADVLAGNNHIVPRLADELARAAVSVIGLSTQKLTDTRKVTILADKAVPFQVIKKVMSTCTSEGYASISLAVLQKASQTASRAGAAPRPS